MEGSSPAGLPRIFTQTCHPLDKQLFVPSLTENTHTLSYPEKKQEQTRVCNGGQLCTHKALASQNCCSFHMNLTGEWNPPPQKKNRRWGSGTKKSERGRRFRKRIQSAFSPESLLLKANQHWWEREQLTVSERGGDSFNLTEHLTYLNVNAK